MRKHIIIAQRGTQALPFPSIEKLCRHMDWNTQTFRNALSMAYKATGKRAVEFRGWKVEKHPFEG